MIMTMIVMTLIIIFMIVMITIIMIDWMIDWMVNSMSVFRIVSESERRSSFQIILDVHAFPRRQQ